MHACLLTRKHNKPEDLLHIPPSHSSVACFQAPVPVIALVGYTNAGKSTLLNSLTEAAVVAEDKLFATLDPTTRRVSLPSSKQVVIACMVSTFSQFCYTHNVVVCPPNRCVLHCTNVSHWYVFQAVSFQLKSTCRPHSGLGAF
jgi:ABC-type branched-subunit amino acid transport system ATPase component